jgi:hypothetical protein
MSGWSELVTTALLGTGRRPLPVGLPAEWTGKDMAERDPAQRDLAERDPAQRDPAQRDPAQRDPAQRVLDLAARHRAWQRVAQAPPAPTRMTAVPPAPPHDRKPTPPEATTVLAGLLSRPIPALINLWLSCADAVGCGVPAAYWTRLARLAAHATAYDRPLLGRVLGERGRWFLQQNPDWRRLAADCALRQVQEAEGAVQGTGRRAQTVDYAPSDEMIQARPDAIFEHPDPWPPSVVAAAYAALGRGGPGRSSRDFAVGVGARLPGELYPGIGAAAEYYLQAPDASPALRRQIRTSFAIVEEAAFARARIEHAFGPPEAGAEFRRIEIPGV